jgi:hypothetical protein
VSHQKILGGSGFKSDHFFISREVPIEAIGLTLLPVYGLKIENRDWGCDFVTVPRFYAETSFVGVYEWVEAEVCGASTKGCNVFLDGVRLCWAHTPQAVQQDIALMYGHRPVHGAEAQLWNKYRELGDFGEDLRVILPGAKPVVPDLVEGSAREVREVVEAAR